MMKKKLLTPGHHLCQESSMLEFTPPFSSLHTHPFMVRNTFSTKAAVTSENRL